jgi:F-type H+-transporting ATPase subunit b
MIKYFNLVSLTILFVRPAYSAGKGLPQLDFTTYPSLIFWSILSLICLYIVMSFVITPKISNVINDREQHLQNDLIKAKALKKESDETLSKVNSQLEQTKTEAKSIIEKAVSDSQISSEKILKDLNFKLNEKIEKALKDMSKEKSKVLQDIFHESFELTNLIISKTSNIKSNKTKLTNIIKQEIKIIS